MNRPGTRKLKKIRILTKNAVTIPREKKLPSAVLAVSKGHSRVFPPTRSNSLQADLALRAHPDFPGCGGQRREGGLASGPADLELGWSGGQCQHLGGTVLGPVAGAGVDFAGGTPTGLLVVRGSWFVVR